MHALLGCSVALMVNQQPYISNLDQQAELFALLSLGGGRAYFVDLQGRHSMETDSSWADRGALCYPSANVRRRYAVPPMAGEEDRQKTEASGCVDGRAN